MKRRGFDMCSSHRSDSASYVSDNRRPCRASPRRLRITHRFDTKVDEQEFFRFDEVQQLVQPIYQECFPIA